MIMMILAIIAGVLTTLSMVINSSLAKKIGVIQGVLVNFIVGLTFSAIVLFAVGSKNQISISEIRNMPTYVFLGGLVGVAIVYASNIVIPKIPVVYTTILLFIGQIVSGIAIDFFLLGEISIAKVIGAIVIALGIIYNSRLGVAKEE